MLWVWARRRHPNKPAKWVKQRYFRNDGLWTFYQGSAQLLRRQDSVCGMCRLPLAVEDMDDHHVKPRHAGGQNTLDNRMLVHRFSELGTAVKVARTVLRGLGEPQGSPGYPAG